MKEIKLNLGSGKTRLKGYLNVDFEDGSWTDVKHDLNEPLPYKDGTVDKIYASHIIEHFWWYDIEDRVNDWYRVLKKGGSLVVWTVDYDKVVSKLEKSEHHLSTFINTNWRLFGKGNGKGLAHHSMFTGGYLNLLLIFIGFRNIGVLDPNKYEFRPLHDGINMGVIAIK